MINNLDCSNVRSFQWNVTNITYFLFVFCLLECRRCLALFVYDLYLIFYNVDKLFNDECYFFIIRMILQVFSFCQMKMSPSFIVFKYQYICFDLLELGKLNRSCTYSWPGNFQVFEVYIQSLFNLPVVYTCDFAIQGQMTQIILIFFF